MVGGVALAVIFYFLWQRSQAQAKAVASGTGDLVGPDLGNSGSLSTTPTDFGPITPNNVSTS